MNLRVIENPDFKKYERAGFGNAQFKMLDSLYLQAVSRKALSSRAVSVDFDEGVAEYSYHKNDYHPALFRFVIRHVGPRSVMYELWQDGKGRVAKSGLFERTFSRLRDEITALIDAG